MGPICPFPALTTQTMVCSFVERKSRHGCPLESLDDAWAVQASGKGRLRVCVAMRMQCICRASTCDWGAETENPYLAQCGVARRGHCTDPKDRPRLPTPCKAFRPFEVPCSALARPRFCCTSDTPLPWSTLDHEINALWASYTRLIWEFARFQVTQFFPRMLCRLPEQCPKAGLDFQLQVEFA